MNIDERNMNMRQMIDKFNKTVKDIDSLKFIIDAVKRQPELEKKEWTANDNNVVIGETYYIQSVGVYKIKGTGKGKISWTVKSPKDMKVLYQGQMDDTAESDEMILTAGDVCYLNASADGGETLVMVLEQIQSLFEMMGNNLTDLQVNIESVNKRLGNIVVSVDTKMNATIDEVKEILSVDSPVTGIRGREEDDFRHGNVVLSPEDIGAVAVDGDTFRNVSKFLSVDTEDDTKLSWSQVSKLLSGETHYSIFGKISQMFKNVRYLYKMLGTTDISKIGNGTCTGAVNLLHNQLNDIGITELVTKLTSLNSSVSIDTSKYREIQLFVNIDGYHMGTTRIPVSILDSSVRRFTISDGVPNSYTYNVINMTKSYIICSQADTTGGWTWCGIEVYGIK